MNLHEILENAIQNDASDIFLIPGAQVTLKCGGGQKRLEGDRLVPETISALVDEIYSESGRTKINLDNNLDDDFSFSIAKFGRFRVNIFRQRGSLAAVIRVIHFGIPDPEKLGIPESVLSLADNKKGLILVTGSAGTGKTTTLACMIDRINKSRACHIITMEDPIEFIHRHEKSIVTQREVYIDTPGYLESLRSALRESPDVILLGEMRDAETIRTAITAAETGHTVIATMHTKGAVNAIDRVIDSFSSSHQAQIRFLLATVLRTVVSQQMLPDKNGNMIPAFEIMHINSSIRGMIRDNKNHQIDNAITAGKTEGMISMDQSILNLYREGMITKETAISYADHPEQMARHLN